MKLMQRMGAITMAAAMAFSLVACGPKENKDPGTQGKDPTAAVAEAVEKFSGLKSFTAEMTSAVDIKIADQAMAMSMSMEVSTFPETGRSKIEVRSSGNGAEVPQMSMYIEPNGDKFDVYASDGTRWGKQEVPADQVGKFDPKSDMKVYMDYVKSYTDGGTEKIGDVEAQRYIGEISGKDSMDLFQKSGDSSSGVQSIASIVKSLPDKNAIEKMPALKVTVWVDPATGYVLREELNIQEFTTDLLGRVAEASGASASDAGVEVKEAIIAVDYRDFDAVEDFEIPAEAKG